MPWPTTEPLVSRRAVVTGERSSRRAHVVNGLYVDDKIRDYIVDIVLATRTRRPIGSISTGYIQTGPRHAPPSAMLVAHVPPLSWAAAFVTPQDVKDVAYDILRHRIAVTYEAEAENLTSESMIAENSRHPARALNSGRR